MKKAWMGLVAGAWMTGVVALGAPAKFDFKDPKGVNTVTFSLDAPLEAITGSANGISGEVQFDPAKPEATKGKIIVATATMHVPNPTMKEHMHGKDWMDVATHPELSFETESLSDVSQAGDVINAKVKGKLTIKGVTKNVMVPVKITYLKDKLGARTMGRMQGDLLVLRASFTVKRSDFGINPKASTESVSDDVQLNLSVAGASPRA